MGSLLFNDFDPVAGRPTINGFAMADIGVLTPESEPGYVNGGRVEIGGSGLAPVVVQSIKDGNTLVLGIMCRGDTSFDDRDTVVIALRPSGTTSSGEQRRIDIKPLWGDAPTPLDPNNLGVGFGAANPDTRPPPEGNPGTHLPDSVEPATVFGAPFSDYTVRTNKQPHIGPIYYQRAGASGPWTAYTPTGSSNTALYHVRARSWLPAVAPGSPKEYAWSIEVRFPIGKIAGAADWIDLNDNFGIFVGVMRAYRYADVDDDGPFATYGVAEFLFPDTATELTGQLGANTDIPAGNFGSGLKGAAVSQGVGVGIANGPSGIGARLKSEPLLSPISNWVSDANDNVIVAQLKNTGPAASGIKAEVRMRAWGLGPPNYVDWQLAPGCDPESPIAVTIGAGVMTGVETVNNWPAAAVAASFPGGTHQCMWVQLKGSGSPVVFTQSSARRNMDFAVFSEENRDAEISGEGYPPPADGSGEHEFVLRTRCRKIIVQNLVGQESLSDETIAIVGGALRYAPEVANPQDVDPATGVAVGAVLRENVASVARRVPTWTNSVVFLWITEGYRRTGQTLEIDGVKMEVLDPRPGDFSIAAHHEGLEDPFSWSLSGTGLIKRGEGFYGLKVPQNGKVKIGVRLGAGPEQKPGDTSNLPPKFPGGDGGPTTGGDGGIKLPDGCGLVLLGMLALPAAIGALALHYLV